MNFKGEFVLRHTTEADLDRVCDFYVRSWDKFNAYRTLDKIQDALNQRSFFVVESRTDHTIRACSGTFSHQNGAFIQAAFSRVPGQRHLGGYGIHILLHRARALHARLMTKNIGKYFAAIDSDNKRSIENALTVGFEEWKSPPVTLRYEALTQEKGRLKFFRLPKRNFVRYARWMLNNEAGVELSRDNEDSGEQETIKVEFDIESLRYYRHLVETLAAGD